MGKTIWNKCPNCDTWCRAEAKGFVGRMFRGWGDSVEETSETGRKLLGGLGETAGAVIGSYAGGVNGIIEAVAGDKFQFVCPECGAKWSTDDESDDESELMAFEGEVLELIEKYHTVCNQGKKAIESFIPRIQAKLGDSRNSDLTKVYLFDLMAVAFNDMGNNEKATTYIGESTKISSQMLITDVVSGYISGAGHNAVSAYSSMKSLLTYKGLADNNVFYTPAQCHDRFVEIQNRYAEQFLLMPVEKRRFLYLVDGNLDDKLTTLPESVSLLPILQLPKDIDFIGTPQENILYICHPYKHNLYIPSSSYQLELLRDELNEFCYVMEQLGAKHIELSDSHSNQQGESSSNAQNVSAGGAYQGYSGKVDIATSTKEAFDMIVQSAISKKQDFLCSKEYPPQVPKEGLVWYPHRQEWQRQSQSRLEGRLVSGQYTIATSHAETISNAKKLTVEAEVKALGAELNASYQNESDYQINQSESYSQQILVEFYPMDEYRSSVTNVIDRVISDSKPNGTTKKRNLSVIILATVVAILAIVLAVVLL